jgi:hypothetical protein
MPRVDRRRGIQGGRRVRANRLGTATARGDRAVATCGARSCPQGRLVDAPQGGHDTLVQAAQCSGRSSCCCRRSYDKVERLKGNEEGHDTGLFAHWPAWPNRRRCAAPWRARASRRDRQWRAISCPASATISQRCARAPSLERHSLVPSRDPGRLVQRLQRPLPVCDGFMPGTERLRRTGNFYRGIAFADFPAERASRGAAPARDQPKWRRFIHACLHACIQGLHCTTGIRRGKGKSMALDFKLLHCQPAAIPCAPSLIGRPGTGISQAFVEIGRRKSEAAHDAFRPTTCTRLTSAIWQVGQSVAALWRCALPATRERCSAISSSFSLLSCRGQPAPSRTRAPVGDGYSYCRALRGLWLFGAVLQGCGAFRSTIPRCCEDGRRVGNSAALAVVWLSFDDKGCSATLRFLLCHQPQQDAALVIVGRRRQKITKFRDVCFTDKLLDDRGRIRFLLCQQLQQGATSVIVGRRRQKLTKFRYICSMDKLLGTSKNSLVF